MKARRSDHVDRFGRYVVPVTESPTSPTDPTPSLVPDLLLDHLDALKVLRASTDEEKDRLLTQIGGPGQVEQEMVTELSAVRPLHHPHRFDEAHRMVVRSLEVLDRNGPRSTRVGNLGPLRPIAEWLIQQVTRWIVRSHQSRVLGAIAGLYERREANSPWGSPEHSMLRRARLDIRRVQAGMSGKALGLPAFLFGGAVLGSLASGLQSLARAALDSTTGVIALGGVLTLVLAALSWVAIYSAGVARRRIRISTDQPVRALWETIGAAGKPPRDESYNFAVYAIVLLVLSWIVVPLVVWLAITA